MDQSNKLFKVREAAQILSVSENTLRGWTSGGEIPFVRLRGKHSIRFRLSDLEKILVQGEAGPKEQL